jgi:uncharacterized membrane protein YdjX (TVP38/TMEM64 family)
MKKTIGFSIAALVLFAVAVYLLIYYTPIQYYFFEKESPQRLAQFIRSFGIIAPLVFILIQIFQIIFAPIPGEVTGFLGGFLFGNFFGLLYSTIGLTIGSWLAFSFSRWVGRPVVERIVKPSIINRFDYLMAHKGAFIAFLLFLVPGFPKDYLCFILGLGHMRLLEFMIISTAGRFFGTAMLTWQGNLAREKNYLALGIIIGVSLLLILVVFLLRERIENYIKRLHQHHQHPRD